MFYVQVNGTVYDIDCFFSGKTAPKSERRGSYTDGSTENIISQIKTKQSYKKECDEVQNNYFTQLHNEQTMTMNFLS